MVVTVSFDNNQTCNNKWFNGGETVSSAPVGRRSSGLMPAGSMEESGTREGGETKKKWSIGKLFRRKKKDSDSDHSSASSDENSQKHNAKRKKTTNKKRSSTPRNNFDITNADSQNGKRSQSVTKFQQKEYYDEGVLSDPSAGFLGYVGRGLPRSPQEQEQFRFRSKESIEKRGPGSSCGSQDGSLRKGRKGRIKARVEAKRNIKNESSSDEESQRSTSSSVFKFRSDDSLANHSKDGSVNKRSRSARNDRYIKRLSKDDEVQLNKEADLIQKGFSRSEAELLSLKQRVLSTPQMNGRGTNEPDYSEPHKIMQSIPFDARRSYSGTQLAGVTNLPNNQMQDRANKRQPVLSTSNSSVYSYPSGVINFNAKVNDESITYSVPYNVNKQRMEILPSKPNFRRSTSVENNNGIYSSPNYENDVMVVKLPLGVHKKEAVAPPPPPPRDPQRKVPTPVSYMYDNTRPLSYAFEPSSQRNLQKQTNADSMSTSSYQNNIYENSTPINKQTGLSWSKRPISSSEDHIAMQQNYYNVPIMNQVSQPKRPSSVSAEVIHPDVYNRYLNRPQINTNNISKDVKRRHTQENTNPEFIYFTDKTPRSRKPIHIAPSPGEQISTEVTSQNSLKPRNASDFWKKLDSQECQRRKTFGHNRTLSDQSVVGNNNIQYLTQNVQNPIRNQSIVVPPSVINCNIKSNVVSSNAKSNILHANKNGFSSKFGNKENEPICYSNIDIIPMDDIRHKSKSSDDDHSNSRRKSTNLEDALSELEAIYNSLGLGDEDLLERAEHREMMAPKTAESLPFSSNENYFRFPSISDYPDGMTRRFSLSEKKTVIPDKVHDDMAYRRLNPHERPKSKDGNNLVSQVSYMLASPILADSSVPNKVMKESDNEPDVILDDVVFRNIRQANNYLRIEDPQPPFGIPIGPISPAPNSDYLHAVPETKARSRFIPQESPDIVNDDLAYRTLRKDSKDPSPINREITGCIYNGTSDNTNLSRPSKIFDNHVIKKKRAIRSLSANIFTLIQKEIDDALDIYKSKGLERAQSIPDLPEAVVEFGKSGKIPENFRASQQLYEPPVNTFVKKTQIEKNDKNEFYINLSEKLGESKPTSVNKSYQNVKLEILDGEEKKSPSKTSKDKLHKESKFDKPAVNYNVSQSPKKIAQNIQDELDTMAEEAKETSARLVIALEELKKDKINKNPEKKTNNNVTESNRKNIQQTTTELTQNLNQKPEKEAFSPPKENQGKINISSHILNASPSIKIKGTIPAHIKEKMEEFARPKKSDSSDESSSQNNIPKPVVTSVILKNLNDESNSTARSTGEHTEDSLIAISNQLRIVGCKLKSNSEQKPDMLEEEGTKLKFLANKCDINLNKSNIPEFANEGVSKSKITKMVQDFDTHIKETKDSHVFHDNTSKSSNIRFSPKLSSRSNIESINNMQSFDDLRKGISELLDGIGNVGEKLHLPNSSTESETFTAGQTKNKTEVKRSVENLQGDDIDKSKDRSSPEYNSSEELAMIFNLKDDASKSNNNKVKECRKIEPNDSHQELSSPRLVKNANQSLRKLSLEESTANADEASRSQLDQSVDVPTSSDVPWRRNRRQSLTDNINKGVV